MSAHTPCSLTDFVHCTKCGRITLISSLTRIMGERSIPNSEEPDKPWRSEFYHCLCDLEHPVVYDRDGDGQLVAIFQSHADLVPGEIQVNVAFLAPERVDGCWITEVVIAGETLRVRANRKADAIDKGLKIAAVLGVDLSIEDMPRY